MNVHSSHHHDDHEAPKHVSLGSLGCSFVFNAALIGMFGYYAFAAPDGNIGCFVTGSDDNLIASPKPSAGSVDIGRKFHLIFLVGFANYLINMFYVLAGGIYLSCKHSGLLKVASCILCVSGLMCLGWIIYAAIVIYGDEAQLCQDTLLPKSGKFIYYYTTITLVLMSIGCVFGVCCGCLSCCAVGSAMQVRH